MLNPKGKSLTPHKPWSLDDRRPQCAKLNSLMGDGGGFSVSQARETPLNRDCRGAWWEGKGWWVQSHSLKTLCFSKHCVGNRRKLARGQKPLVTRVCACCCVQLFATPWTVAHQAPPSVGFPGRDTGAGCRALLPGIFPTQGVNSGLLELWYWHTGPLPLGSQGPFVTCRLLAFCCFLNSLPTPQGLKA